MAHVVVVHGIGQQFLGPELMCKELGPALRDGVRLAGGPRLDPADVVCAFYGDVYFEPGTRSWDLPPWDEYDVDDPIELELLHDWWTEAARVDPAVPDPEADGTRGPVGYVVTGPLRAQWVRAALDALSGSRYFGTMSDRLLIFGLKQVRRYMTDPAIRAAARARVAAEITPDTRVVIAHSLGSVVAYETLCANPQWDQLDLVTLGSPLGLRSIVFDRLDPAPVDGAGAWPTPVRSWTNIADPGDIVALANTLATRFPNPAGDPIDDQQITNGVRMHDLLRYLTAPRTGAAIAKSLNIDP